MDSFLGVPIRRGDTVFGSLYLTNKVDGGAFTRADEIAVQALGAHAAVAIHNLHTLTRQRALVRGLITAQEEERRNIAFDLHDGLTQYVMASHAHLETFKRLRNPEENPRAERELEQAVAYLHEAVQESRRLVNGLRSLALDDLGLAGALEQLIQEEKTRAGWDEAVFTHEIGLKRYDRTLETSAYRVAQEALSNVRKHAGAKRVAVTLREEAGDLDRQLRLEVRDWGHGFDVAAQSLEPGHFGLHGIAERAHLIGGRAMVQSTPGQGTLVSATFPALESAND